MLRRAWDVYKAAWQPLTIGALLVAAGPLLQSVVGLDWGVGSLVGLAALPVQWLVSIVGGIVVSSVISAFGHAAMIHVALAAVRGQRVQIDDAIRGASRGVPLLIGNFVIGFCLLVSALLFIVPYVILSIGWAFWQFLVMDRNLGLIEAVSTSWRLTNGYKIRLAVFVLVSIVLSMAGLFLGGIGMLVTAPLAMVMNTIIYLRLAARPGILPPEAPRY